MGHWSRREVLGAMVAGGACALAPPLLESRPISGVWLRGVLLVDGSLAPPRYTDVLVMGDRISDIGPAPEAATRGARVIDGAGRVLAPGFIDMHAHGDPLTDSYAPHVARDCPHPGPAARWSRPSRHAARSCPSTGRRVRACR